MIAVNKYKVNRYYKQVLKQITWEHVASFKLRPMVRQKKSEGQGPDV